MIHLTKRLFHSILPFLVLQANVTAWALGTEQFGNSPLSEVNYRGWPSIVPLVNHSNRVYCTWVNGNEEFYYRGGTAALNDALRKFAAIQAPVHEVLLRPGPGVARAFNLTDAIPFDWNLHLVGGVSRGLTTLQKGDLVWNKSPTLTVYVSEEADLAKVEILPRVSVIGIDDLSRRYRDALTSKNSTVRGWGSGELARLDAYNTENLAAIAKLLQGPDEWVKLNAALAIAKFGEKAHSLLPELRGLLNTTNEPLKKRIQETISTIEQAKPDPGAERKHAALLGRINEYCTRLKDSRIPPWEIDSADSNNVRLFPPPNPEPRMQPNAPRTSQP